MVSPDSQADTVVQSIAQSLCVSWQLLKQELSAGFGWRQSLRHCLGCLRRSGDFPEIPKFCGN
jgi:hypothetical protein